MIRRLLLIDYENIHHFDLARLDADVDVVVFVGVGQKIPPALKVAANKLGDRVMWLKMGGTGPNALDFHIACYLGRVLEMESGHTCYVLSHDHGFDPLLKHLNAMGLATFRIESLASLGIELSEKDEAVYQRIAVTLRRQPKASRPKSRAALIKTIAAQYRVKPSALHVNAIVARMIKSKLLVLRDDDSISYG